MLEYINSKKFQRKVLNFPDEVYGINDPSTHIFKYMYTLLEIGLGQLELWQDEASNSESVPGTKYTDLDALFSFYGLVRLPEEFYSYDPYSDQLTYDQWNEILTKDSLFRLRLMKFFQSLLRGGTLEGIQMVAEAASGVQCQVFEMWRVISGKGLASGLDLARSPALDLAKEFVIIPLEEIDDNQRVCIIHLVDLIKPVNTISTVRMSPTISMAEYEFPFSATEDYFYEVRKMVTASDELSFAGTWINPNTEVEAPTFAGMSVHDAEWSLNGSVTGINSYITDEQYLVTFAVLAGGINDTVTSLVADEIDAPSGVAFLIKIGSEEMFVSERTPVVGSDTQYTYTVSRAQNGTTAASHSNNDDINNGTIALTGDQAGYDAQFGPWIPIPVADSPDNYPVGQYPGDPAKYDTNGDYVYDYDSQISFLEWFTLRIQAIGGEIDGTTRYRMPVTVDYIGGLTTTPDDALGPPELTVSTRIYPNRERL